MLVTQKGSLPFVHRRQYESGFAMSQAHIHEHHELYYLESGSTSYFCGNSIYRLHAGDLILVPKGVFHRTENGMEAGLVRVLFNFDDDFLGEDFLPFLQILKEAAHIVLPETEKRSVRRLIQCIEAEENTDDPQGPLLQRLYFGELILLLCRHRKQDVIEEPTGTYKIAQDAARFISENYREELHLDTLAKRYAVSTGYFSKLFKKHTGVGVNEYITVVRVMAAKELLDKGDMTVTQVAFACGFNDSNYFSQIFKRATGITPKRYAMKSETPS